jgi:hypothetical protein
VEGVYDIPWWHIRKNDGEASITIRKKQMQDYIQKKHIQDYVILDDFYAELNVRNQALSKNMSQDKLERSNKHLLELANDALQKIDWEKYN